jgi:hypothetical protein
MKKGVFVVLLLLLCQVFFPNHSYASSSNHLIIHEADIYPKGARVYLKLPIQNQDILLVDIPSTLQKDSVRISASGGVQIVETRFGGLVVNDQLPQGLEELAQKLKAAQRERDLLASKLEGLVQSINKLDETPAVGKTAEEIISFVEKLSSKRQKLQMEIYTTNQALDDAKKRYETLKKELESYLPPDHEKYNRFIIKTQGQGDVIISAWTYLASWSPSYHLDLNSSTSTIEGALKATITQNTGIPWNGRIRLHTTMPKESLYIPKLPPLVVDFEKEEKYLLMEARKSVQIENVASTETQEYNLTDVVYIAQGEVSSSKPSVLEIKSFTLRGSTSIVCIPEFSREAWAVATVEHLNEPIIEGKAEFYIDGNLSAQSTLPRAGKGEKLEIPFGKTPLVKVEKEYLIPKEGQKWTGKGWIKKGYAITVTNGTNDDINVTVLDRIPTSANEDIKVEDINITPAPEEQDEKGIVKWNLPIKRGDNKKIEVSYIVKFPANKEITFR